MQKTLFILTIILCFSCNNNSELLVNKTWFPIKVEGEDNSTLRLHAITFTDSGKLINRTLGTDYEVVSNYWRNGNVIYYNLDKDTIELSINLISENELVVEFDSVSTVTYTHINSNKQDLTRHLTEMLTEETWILNGSTLIEFNDQLETNVVKPYYQDKLHSAVLHSSRDGYYKNHLGILWSANYYEGANIMMFGGQIDLNENKYFILETVSDTLISGYGYNHKGKKEEVWFRASNHDTTTRSLLLGNWRLESFEEVPERFGEVRGTFGDEKEEGINRSDLDNKNITISFSKNQTFEMGVGPKICALGKWQMDRSGQIVTLIAEYNDDDRKAYRTTYIHLLNITGSELKLFKKEDIIIEKGEMEVKGFVEIYKKDDDTSK